MRCLRYCKSTIFQANHNLFLQIVFSFFVVCDTAKVRFFKQITTYTSHGLSLRGLFAILQKYDFSSKSQLEVSSKEFGKCCLRYCKSTIFQANHNNHVQCPALLVVVCDTAKVRFFKQITTFTSLPLFSKGLFAILQKYDFSSKSQQILGQSLYLTVVCDTAKVRFFKQITTRGWFNLFYYGCLRYCKSTIFQANHNEYYYG